jgi:hypothetical protein
LTILAWFSRLGTIDEGYSALLGESNCHLIIGYSLHDGGYQRNVHGKSRLFTFFELDHGSLQRNVLYAAIGVGIARYQQIFIESS